MKVIILVQNGVVQRVFTDDDVDVIIVDYDCQSKTIDGAEVNPVLDGQFDPVKVYPACTSVLADVPDYIQDIVF